MAEKRKPRVLIVNGDSVYRGMFYRAGWEVTDHISRADMIQFTGGADVSPRMYNERAHPTTMCSPGRDSFESAIFEAAKAKGLPMAGICRGGQFLNVMCGGAMWQDVNNHAIGDLHKAYDTIFKTEVMVSSTHHQMMRPSAMAEIVLTAKLSTRKERMGQTGAMVVYSDAQDVEGCFYEKPDCLCFQPHPEFMRSDLNACRQLYFNYIEFHFGLGGVPQPSGGE